MGAANSVPQASYVDSPENEKAKMFSTIFLRLLQETDIVDINALTRGPGACGSYAVILEKELKKEFKAIKLQTTVSGLKDVRDFLYSKAKNIESESPSDANACRELAIFYIRLLQLVSALTLSIYTPADLIDRIRNNASITALRKQEKNSWNRFVDTSCWVTDVAKSRILYISPAYEKIWGRSCESLYANPADWYDAVHPEDRPRSDGLGALGQPGLLRHHPGFAGRVPRLPRRGLDHRKLLHCRRREDPRRLKILARTAR